MLLLTSGQDNGSTGEFCIVQRAHGIPQPRRYMDVASDEAARGSAEPVRNSNHEAFLHRHHVGQIGMFLQRMHDRQFSGPRIAEKMRDALVLEHCEECRASGDAIHRRSPIPPGVTVGPRAS